MSIKSIFRRLCQVALFFWVLMCLPMQCAMIPGGPARGPDQISQGFAMWFCLGPIAAGIIAWIILGNERMGKVSAFFTGDEK